MITLKQAKQLSKILIGRLPKAGMECILLDGKYYRISLVNRSGKFEINTIQIPFANQESYFSDVAALDTLLKRL